MELDRFLNLFAVSLGTLGSVYVLKSYLAMTPKIAAAVATPMWGFSLPVLDSLSAQRAESIVGAIAFLLALAVGVVGTAFAPATPVFPSRLVGFAIDVVGTALALGILSFIATGIRKRHNIAARVIMLSSAFDDIVIHHNFGVAYVDALAQSADVLLSMKFQAGTSAAEMVKAVGERIERDVPADVVHVLMAGNAT